MATGVELATAYVSLAITAKGARSGIERELRGAERDAKASGERIGKNLTSGIEKETKDAGGGLVTMLGAVKMAAVGVVGAVGFAGAKTAMEMEQTQIAFETMLGSGEKARKFLGDLAQFAAKTPFELPELQQAAQSLVSIGVKAEKVIPIMTTLGNVTSGMGTGAEGVQRATRAIQQMNAAQKISGEDLAQLRDAGIPVYELLAAATGKSTQALAEMASKGKLGKQELELMMKALESGKGFERFNGMMDKQSKSLGGMISTLKDTVGVGMAQALAPLIPLMKSSIEGLTGLLTPLMNAIAKTGEIATLTVGKLAPLVPLLKLIAPAATGAALGLAALTGATKAWAAAQAMAGAASALTPWGKAALVIGALVGVLIQAWQTSETFRNVVTGAFNTVKGVALGLVDSVMSVVRGIKSAVNTPFGQSLVLQLVQDLVGWFQAKLPVAIDRFRQIIGAAWAFVQTNILPVGQQLWGLLANVLFPALMDIGRAVMTQLVPAFMNFVTTILTSLRPTLDALWAVFTQNILPVLGNLWTFIRQSILPAFGAFVSIIVPVVSAVAQFGIKIASFLLPILGNLVGFIFGSVMPILIRIAGFLTQVLGVAFVTVGTVIAKFAEGFFNVIRWAFNAATGVIGAFLKFFGGIPRTFSTVVGIVSTIWGGLKALVANPVEFIINQVLRPMAQKYNDLAGFFPGAPKISPLPYFAAGGGKDEIKQPVYNLPNGVKMYARGGMVEGYSPHDSADNIWAKLTAGEFVIPRKATRQLMGQFGRAGLEMLRRGKHPLGSDENPGARAGGPRTTPIQGAGPGDSGIWRQMAAWVRANIPGAIVTSAYRNTYTASGNISNHARGMALDLAGGPGMMAIFNKIRQAFPNSLELIHTPAGSQQLRGGKPFVYSGSTAANHYDHVHWSVRSLADGGSGGTPGAGAGIIAHTAQWAADQLKGIVSAAVDGAGKVIPGFGGSGLAGLAKAVPNKVIDAIKAKLVPLEQTLDYSSDVGQGPGPAGPAVTRWTDTVKQALGIAGLPQTNEYVQAWLRQIASESSGNPNAVQGNIGDINNKTGDLAKGLVQVIGATFAAYRDPSLPNDRFNPLSNLVAGMRYAKARYKGRILGVIGHGHGYASGGQVTDNILARVTAGEFILPKDAVSRLYKTGGAPLLESLRRGTPGFASGGLVPGGPSLINSFNLSGTSAKTVSNIVALVLGKWSDQLEPEAQRVSDAFAKIKDAIATGIGDISALTDKVTKAQEAVKAANQALAKAQADAKKNAAANTARNQAAVKAAQNRVTAAEARVKAARVRQATVLRNKKATAPQRAAAQAGVTSAQAALNTARNALTSARSKGGASADFSKLKAAQQTAAKNLATAQKELAANKARQASQTKINAVLDEANRRMQIMAVEAASTKNSLDESVKHLNDLKKEAADYADNIRKSAVGKFSLSTMYGQATEALKSGSDAIKAEMDAIASRMLKGDFTGGPRYQELMGQLGKESATNPVQKMLEQMRAGEAKIVAFKQTVLDLQTMGLNDGLLKQIMDENVDALPMAEAIKAAGPSMVQELNSVQSRMESSSKDMAVKFADIVYGEQITAAQKATDAWQSAMDTIMDKMTALMEKAKAVVDIIAGGGSASLDGPLPGGGGVGGSGAYITPGVVAGQPKATAKTSAQIVAEIAAKRAAELAAIKAGTARNVSGATMAARTAADLKAAGLPPTTQVTIKGNVGWQPTTVAKQISVATTKAQIVAGVKK